MADVLIIGGGMCGLGSALLYIGTITPIQQIVQRPDVAERIRVATEAMQDSPPIVMPGPDRRELLDLVA